MIELKLTPIRQNMTELLIGHRLVLFSYETPVAYLDVPTNIFYVTDAYYSVTTSRHINEWVGDNRRVVTNQSQIQSSVKV